MAAVEFADFKKHFEKTPFYATTATQIQRVDATRKALKGAKKDKYAEAVVNHSKTLKESIQVIKKWEDGLDPVAKKIAESKKVVKSFQDEFASVEKTLLKLGQKRGQPQDAGSFQNAGGARGNVNAVLLPVIENAEPELTRVERYVASATPELAAIKAGTISHEALFALDKNGKELVGKSEFALDYFKRAQIEISELAGTNKAAPLTSEDKQAVKDGLTAMGNYIRRINAAKAGFESIRDVIQSGRKSAMQAKDGWLALAERAISDLGEVEATVSKCEIQTDNVFAKCTSIMTDIKDPRQTTISPKEGAVKLKDLYAAQTYLRNPMFLATNLFKALCERHVKFESRVKTLLESSDFASLAKIEPEIANAGKKLSDTHQTTKPKIDQLTAKMKRARDAVVGANRYVNELQPYYEDFRAAVNLEPTNKKK